MTRFYDECDEPRCDRPVKKVVADRVKYSSDPHTVQERRVVGLCEAHKRDPKVIWESDPDIEEPLPF